MMVKHKFNTAFGSTGSFAGYFLVAAGVAASFQYWEAISLAIFGAFIAFTYSCTFLDIKRRRVKFANMFFGIFPNGKWVAITPDMQLGVKKAKRVYSTYSRGNRRLDLARIRYQIILYNSFNSSIMPLAEFATLELAQAEVDNLMKHLELKAYVL